MSTPVKRSCWDRLCTTFCFSIKVHVTPSSETDEKVQDVSRTTIEHAVNNTAKHKHRYLASTDIVSNVEVLKMTNLEYAAYKARGGRLE